MSEAKIAFKPETVRIPLADLNPTRLAEGVEKSVKRYATILASIQEVGVIEPLAVYPHKSKRGKYLIMDGNLRFHALRQIGSRDALCIIADQDECFTYNARISRMSPIQEHRMIAKAVRDGVSVDRIATALNLSAKYVEDSLNLLSGLHPDAIELLESKHVSHAAIYAFRRVMPTRQVEMAELMVAANDFSASYAKALVTATHEELLVEKKQQRKIPTISEEEEAFLRHEMQHLEEDFKNVEESYGDNILKLTTARAYLKSLLSNTRVSKWLNQRHGDIVVEFQAIVNSDAL